jgi:adenylate cyclase
MDGTTRLETMWRGILDGNPALHTKRFLYTVLPSSPRCHICHSPFGSFGGALLGMFGVRRSRLNPNFCNTCENYLRKNPGGAETDLTLLFVDIRGSTTMAERIAPVEFSKLIDRFYKTTQDVLIDYGALIEKLVGDEVASIFVPGFAGPHYARKAIEAARKLLTVTGHGDSNGPWIPVGVGVHWGKAWVGAVGSANGVVEMTALGDVPNVTARLASSAGKGEVLVSEDAWAASRLSIPVGEERLLSLKGRKEPVKVKVLVA